ncbi:MAG: GRAS family protein [Myxococcota bacterium]
MLTTQPDILERVQAAGRLLAARDPEVGESLDALLADTEAPSGPRERLARLVVGALLARRQGAAADIGNLYGGAAGPAEMLGAFEVFVRDTPLVRFAHHAANAAHLAAIGDAASVCILDIGLGLGSQWEPLLRDLGRRPGGAPRLHLVGIDLPAPGSDPAAALDAVGARLAGVAAACGVPFTFTALPGRIEDVDLPAARHGECLTINAAFALHHTGAADRDDTLRRLAATGADAIVLCEPEADHDAPAFPDRLDAALHHYGLVFQVLDRCLPAGPAARAVIEGQFFGREIHNVVVGEGAARVERHAPAADWSRRLRAAGLRPIPVDPGGVPDLPEGVAVVALGPACALTVDGHPLVVVSAWRH